MKIFLGCTAFFCLVEFLLYRRRERKLKELTLYLLKLQDGAELPPFESFEEGQLGVLQSEIYKMVNLLDEETKKSKRQNHYLADMLSDISHQIKTPLAGITLMTDLLKDPELPEEKREEFVEKIDRQTEKITWLVRNLLTLAQLEADMLKLKKEIVSARELVETAIGPLNILAELKGVELKTSLPEGTALTCDKAWTAEALSNVIKNCIEHVSAEAGKHVWISVTENNFAVTFTIQDDGPGIPAEELPHIFERFYKGKNSSKKQRWHWTFYGATAFSPAERDHRGGHRGGEGHDLPDSFLQRSLAVSFPVLFRGAVHVFSEHAVEIADIAVAAAGGDGAYGLGAGEKLVAGRADAVVIDVFDEGHVDLGFEKTAELPFAHVKGGGKSFERQNGAIMLLNEPEDFFREEDF